MAMFQRRPERVEAVQYRRSCPEDCNCAEVDAFLGNEHDPVGCAESADDVPYTVSEGQDARSGDWIVRGASGVLNVVSDRVFRAEYEPVQESPDA